ncbi:unnamed protein product, partial [Heterosigma akashiwo]
DISKRWSTQLIQKMSNAVKLLAPIFARACFVLSTGFLENDIVKQIHEGAMLKLSPSKAVTTIENLHDSRRWVST